MNPRVFFSSECHALTLVSHHCVNQLVLQVVELLSAEKDGSFLSLPVAPTVLSVFVYAEISFIFICQFIFISAFSQTRQNQSSSFLRDKYSRNNVTNSLQPTSFC